jgi:hypothetical protein
MQILFFTFTLNLLVNDFTLTQRQCYKFSIYINRVISKCFGACTCVYTSYILNEYTYLDPY